MIVLGIIVVVLLAAFLFRESQHAKHLSERERTWDIERGALLTRIQHPEVVPPPQAATETAGAVQVPPAEEDEIDLIGAVMDGTNG